jgi:anti-anti-sigma factor
MRESLLRAVERRRWRVIVDLSGARFIGAAGLRCLLQGDSAMRRKQGRFVVVAQSPHLKRLFALLDVGGRLKVVSSLDAAFDA